MLRRFLIVAGLVALFAPVGCNTREPVLWSWPHNKRKILRIADGFHDLHMSVDRILFDLDEYPLEPDYY